MQEFLRYDGQHAEWNGILPDNLVIQDPNHLAKGVTINWNMHCSS
jgi:hypothetical protein